MKVSSSVACAVIAGWMVLSPPAVGEGPSRQDECARALRSLELKGARATPETLAALDDLERELEDPVLRVEARRFRGDCLRKGGQLADAVVAYESVAANVNARLYQRLDALRAISESYWIMGRYEEAAAHFQNLEAEVRKVTDPNPEPQLRELLGWLDVASAHHYAAVLGSLGRGEDALRAYDHAIELNTPPRGPASARGFTNARARVNQATIAESMGLVDRSVRYLNAARREDPAFFAPYVAFKLLQFADLTPGSVERTRALEGILESYPDDPWSVVIHVILYHELLAANEVAAAKSHLLRVVDSPPVESGAYGGTASLFEAEAWLAYINRMMVEKNYPEAERAVGVFLARYPSDPRAALVRDDYMADLAELRAAGEFDASAPEAVLSEAPAATAKRFVRLLAWLPYLIANGACAIVFAGWWYRGRQKRHASADRGEAA